MESRYQNTCEHAISPWKQGAVKRKVSHWIARGLHNFERKLNRKTQYSVSPIAEPGLRAVELKPQQNQEWDREAVKLSFLGNYIAFICDVVVKKWELFCFSK